jgi:hypothetical protein
MIRRVSLVFLAISLVLSACVNKTAALAEPLAETAPVLPTASQTPVSQTAALDDTAAPPTGDASRYQPSKTPLPSATLVPTPTLTPDRRLNPQEWRQWPVIPQVSESTRLIFQHGQALGNDAGAFIKVGDCESTPTWFLGDFDSEDYQIAQEYQDLEAVIANFQGSFERTSLAAKSGFNIASVLSPLWADPKQCDKKETPLDCEIRIMNPAFALITLGTNDVWHEEKFEESLVAVVEHLIEKGIVPILATKADNLEGDHAINRIIAQVAYDYDLPLWNFWLAVQELPEQGLQEDLAHLTWAPNRFDDPLAMQKAWPNRNLTALQTLQSVWQGVQ